MSVYANMMKISLSISAILFSALLPAQNPFSPVLDRAEPGAFPIVQSGAGAAICPDPQDENSVRTAANWLQHDIALVSGREPAVLDAPTLPYLIVVGSVGHSALLRQLAAAGNIRLDSLTGQWEAYQIQVVDHPWPGGESPRLDYRFWSADTGTVQVSLYFSPTLNFNESASLQCAVSIDDDPPQRLAVTPDLSVTGWSQLVAANISIVSIAYRLAESGVHTLKYWPVDPGVVLQRITVTRGPEKASYLGPPETRVFVTGPDEKGLKDYYADYFPVGVAVSPQLLDDVQSAGLIKREFNSLTAENVMKPGPIHPEEDRYNWAPADRIVEFAQANGLRVRGHTLCWHNQTPAWFFRKDGREVTRDELLARMQAHIAAVVGRYRGKIYAWDVVNEAVPDGGDSLYRPTDYYRIIGPDYIEKAFEYAHAADPAAKLFYNDYNTENPAKRERIYRLLKSLKEKGVPIHGVGLQGHWSIYEPDSTELEASIEKFASLGVDLQFTEVDVSVYPKEHSSRERLPSDSSAFTPEQEQMQAARYKMLFDIFRKHRAQITGVTFWNLSDRHSWLDDFPVRGRKDYPLLFDQDLERKKAYEAVTAF